MALELDPLASHTSRDSDVASAEPSANESSAEASQGSQSADSRSSSSRSAAHDGADRSERLPRTVQRYIVEELLGRGAQGLVIKAFDPELRRMVALKRLHVGTDGDQRVLDEARSGAGVNHPNVVGVFDRFTFDGSSFIAMEFMPGGSLREWLTTRVRTFPEIHARYLEAGRGLTAIHARGWVHRDFKPDNVLLKEDGTAAVGDFGLARAADNVTSSRSGTRRFMAPELEQLGEATAASDQYAYCVSLFRALTGDYPSAERPLRFPAANTTPVWVRRVLERGLSRSPVERYPSMNELLEELSDNPDVKRRALVRSVSIGALVVALATTALVWLLTESPGEKARRTCVNHAGTMTAALWTPRLADTIQKRFTTLAGTAGTQTFERLRVRLEEDVTAWGHASEAACELTDPVRQRLTQNCLLERRAILRAQGDYLSTITDASFVPDAMRTLSLELKPVGECQLASALPQELGDGPDDAQLRAQLAPALVLRAAGRLEEARTLAVQLAGNASQSPRVEAEARLLAGQLEVELKEPSADQRLIFAIAAADRLGADELRARGWISLISFHAGRLEIPAASDAERQASAIVSRLGSPAVLLAPLLNQRGNLAWARDDVQGAHEFFKQHHALLLQSHPAGDALVLRALNNVVLTGEPEDQPKGFAELLAQSQRELGDGHPETLFTRHNLATALLNSSSCPAALKEVDQVIASRRSGGEHLQGPLGGELALRARIEVCLGNLAQAEEDQRESLELRGAKLSDQQAQREWSWLYGVLEEAHAPAPRLAEVKQQVCDLGFASPDGSECPKR